MPRSVGGVWVVLALVLALGCPPARAEQTLDGEQRVDPSYQMQSFQLEASRDRLVVWLKATPQDGKLRVCAAYLAIMSEERFNRLQGWLRDLNSYLLVGSVTGRGQRVHPSFLLGRRLAGGDAPIQRTDERPAGCVVTDAAWSDSYAQDRFVFMLAQTSFVRGR